MKNIFLLVSLMILSFTTGVEAQRRATSKRSATSKKPKTVGQVLKMIQSENRGQKVQLTKYKSALPTAQQTFKAPPPKNLTAIKPPRSQDLFRAEGGGDEVEYEKITDQSIRELYRITQRAKNSPNRGELWLRLAELYVEKARVVEYRKRDEFDKKMADVQAGKSKVRPVLNLKVAQEYNQKAIQLYEWFLKDYPKDKKVDQALFFLGYNYFEIGNPKKGASYYERLTKEFPRSPYVSESHFALGEYYFDLGQWKQAKTGYENVLRNRRSRLYTFALYKLAWCQYRTGELENAMRNLERVVVYSRERGATDNISGRRAVNRIRLAAEALKDLIVFYAEARPAREANEYFTRVGGEKVLFPTLEKLAYRYTDLGKRDDSRYIFKQLLDQKPTAPKAFDWQYQIVMNYLGGPDQKVFREELYHWINDYGHESEWARANQKDKELLAKAYEQREGTLRNYTLNLHKTAQTTRTPHSQALAASAYALYSKTFNDSKHIAEMRFFYGELLYDMRKYEEASIQYLWVADNAPKSKYHENAIVNAMLALEHGLPSEQELAKMTGKSLSPVPFGQSELKFEAAAKKYINAFPKGERVVDVKFKLGRLHYAYNHMDEALAIFQEIVQNHPRSKNAVYAANLTLDIYNLRKDYDGLTRSATDMLANKGLVSQGFGDETQEILERANFKKAQEAEVAKNYEKAAKDFEAFAKSYPRSKLATSAQFNSAINYERSGHILDSIRMYGAVIQSRDKESQAQRTKSRMLLARLYEQTGQYQKAAQEFESFARDFPKDPTTPDLYYNAGIIRAGLQNYTLAIKDFEFYLNTSRKRDRFEVLFIIAEIQEKRNAFSLAIQYFKRYLESSANAAKVIEAHYRIARISDRMGRKGDAKEWYQKTVGVQSRLAKGTATGAWFAADSKFRLTLALLEEFKAIRIPANPKQAEAAVQTKLKLINRLQVELANVIKYDSGDQVVASLATLGQAYEHMYKAIENSPIPKGLKPDEAELYRKELAKVSDPFRKQAIENFELAINRAGELRVSNEYLVAALKGMQGFDPERYVDSGEIVLPTQVPDYMGL